MGSRHGIRKHINLSVIVCRTAWPLCQSSGCDVSEGEVREHRNGFEHDGVLVVDGTDNVMKASVHGGEAAYAIHTFICVNHTCSQYIIMDTNIMDI